MSGVVQFDLFDNTPDKVAEREEREAARRVVDDERKARVVRYVADTATDWRAPGHVVMVTLPWEPADGVNPRPGIRCGRCGEAILPHGFDHDLGWCGCPDGSPGRRQLTEAEFVQRADAEVAPDCVGCGHPWGLHDHVIVEGGFLPAQMGCTVCYRCDGYRPPPMAATPWGTCPGCWGDPHKGPCPDPRRE